MCFDLVVLDGERHVPETCEQTQLEGVLEIIEALLARTAASGNVLFPTLAVAKGQRLTMMDECEPQIPHGLLKCIQRTIDSLMVGDAPSEPSILALKQIPPEVLMQIEYISFVTLMRGRSCRRVLVVDVLEHLSRVSPTCMVELVLRVSATDNSGPRSIPTELLLLQAEHNVNVHLLEDSVSVARWISARIAQQQSISIELQAEFGRHL